MHKINEDGSQIQFQQCTGIHCRWAYPQKRFTEI